MRPNNKLYLKFKSAKSTEIDLHKRRKPCYLQELYVARWLVILLRFKFVNKHQNSTSYYETHSIARPSTKYYS